MASWPCTNPNCASNGKPHPNCHCPAPMAGGGEAVHYCSTKQKHLQGCQYFAEGGDVATVQPPPEHPSLTVSHVVASKGLLGLLKDIGHTNMQDPEKHIKTIQDAKSHHMVKTEYPDTPRPRTLGGKLGHHLAEGNHEAIAESMSGHPMMGLVGKSPLKSAMGHLAGPLISNEPHPAAFRSSVDYLASAEKGKNLLDKHVQDMIGKSGNSLKSDPKTRNDLKQQLDKYTANPNDALQIGGDLDHYLPQQSSQIGALSSTAISYLNSIKPANIQQSPFDTVLKPSKAQESLYDRQLDIAQNPLMVLQHAKDGALIPTDVATLQTVYPSLYQSMVTKIGQQVIESTAKGVKLPYKMRSSLSLLLGQPLDSTMTSQSMQAIIASAAHRGAQGPKKGGESATTLKATDKAISMSETPLQSREANKKS